MKVDLNRRDFAKLTFAALTGMLASTVPGGSLLAENEKKEVHDVHVCCGLNTCSGLGADGRNTCVGMGTCATVDRHPCATHNDCRGQGGGGSMNACRGKGPCAVPVTGDAWKKARANFETSMKKAGKKFGAAPKICGQ